MDILPASRDWTPPKLKRRILPVAALLTQLMVAPVDAAPLLPEIRIGVRNAVPACVTPDRLMRFVTLRNESLDPRYRDIARWYRRHGETWGVRWDYAFFQMLLETNFLTYRRPNGRPGDVDPRQNNFAGIGATGGGVPGDRFPNVGTGVLAQIQHLVAYSGEFVERPVAPRTALKQSDIIEVSRRLRRPVRFSDLARRWAADPRYANSIGFIAGLYRERFCSGTAGHDDASPEKRSAAPAPSPKSAMRPDPQQRQVFRTVWHRNATEPQALPKTARAPRGQPEVESKAVETIAVPVPTAAVRRHVVSEAGRIETWSAMARLMALAVVPPVPRVAVRPARFASNP